MFNAMRSTVVPTIKIASLAVCGILGLACMETWQDYKRSK